MYLILFTVGLLAFSEAPPVAVGDEFLVLDAGENGGPYVATAVLFLPDGAYPPTSGEAPCPGSSAASWRATVKSSDVWEPPLWAVCVEPSPPLHAFLVAAIRTFTIFSDGFESGDFGRWDVVAGASPRSRRPVEP